MEKYLLKNLFNEKKYDEIIEIYSTDHSTYSEWDYYFTIKAYYSKKMYGMCIQCYNEMAPKYPLFTNADDLIGWSLYYTDIKEPPLNNQDDRSISALRWILDKSSDTNNLIRWKSIERYYKSRKNRIIDYGLIDEYLQKIDSKTLSEDVKEFNVDGRDRELASDKENWYKLKSKMLFRSSKYRECIEIIEESFKEIKAFHSNNDIWLKIDMIKCYLKLGDIDKAEKIMGTVLEESKKKHFSHWCINEKSFDIQVAKSNMDLAVKYGAQCSIADLSHDKRVTFYLKYADYLNSIGMGREAALHCRFVQLIREENGWGDVETPPGIIINDDVRSMDKESTLKELDKFWHNEVDKGKDFRKGIVKRILPNGFAGFIKDNETGEDYYFSIRDLVNRKDKNNLNEGTSVRYTLEERFDKKKGRMCLNAIEISIIQ